MPRLTQPRERGNDSFKLRLNHFQTPVYSLFLNLYIIKIIRFTMGNHTHNKLTLKYNLILKVLFQFKMSITIKFSHHRQKISKSCLGNIMNKFPYKAYQCFNVCHYALFDIPECLAGGCRLSPREVLSPRKLECIWLYEESNPAGDLGSSSCPGSSVIGPQFAAKNSNWWRHSVATGPSVLAFLG